MRIVRGFDRNKIGTVKEETEQICRVELDATHKKVCNRVYVAKSPNSADCRKGESAALQGAAMRRDVCTWSCLTVALELAVFVCVCCLVCKTAQNETALLLRVDLVATHGQVCICFNLRVCGLFLLMIGDFPSTLSFP